MQKPYYDEAEQQCVRHTVYRYVKPWQENVTDLILMVFQDYRPMYRRQANFTLCTLIKQPIKRGRNAGASLVHPENRWAMFIGMTKRHPTLDRKDNPLLGRMESLSRAVRDLLAQDDRENYEWEKDVKASMAEGNEPAIAAEA